MPSGNSSLELEPQRRDHASASNPSSDELQSRFGHCRFYCPSWRTSQTNPIKKSVPVLLLSSALIFGVLVPGGPVETRNFSHLSPWIIVAFNIFLTALGLSSLVLAYLQMRRKADAFMLGAFLGVSYFAVYMLDLLQIFPTSPDPTPQTLWLLEILGTIVSLPLMATSILAARNAGNSRGPGYSVWATGKGGLYVLLFLVVAGIGIIVFASYAAMGK